MILSTRIRKVFLVQHRVDFRKHHDGLLAEAFNLGKDPFMGDLMIFVGRGKSRLRLLRQLVMRPSAPIPDGSLVRILEDVATSLRKAHVELEEMLPQLPGARRHEDISPPG